MIEQQDGIEDVTKVGTLADEKKSKKSRDRQEMARLQLASDLKLVMNAPAGRRLMRAIIGYTRIDQLAFRGTDRDTCHALGVQITGEWLRAQMKVHCLDLMRLMEDEEIADERNNG